MVTYLIRETWPDVNGNWLVVVGGINTPLPIAVFTLGFMAIKGAGLDVVFNLVVLGWIISNIFAAWSSIYLELSLFYSVYNPINPHIHGFVHFLLDGLIGNSYRCGVIHLDGSWRLWPVHFDQSSAYGY